MNIEAAKGSIDGFWGEQSEGKQLRSALNLRKKISTSREVWRDESIRSFRGVPASVLVRAHWYALSGVKMRVKMLKNGLAVPCSEPADNLQTFSVRTHLSGAVGRAEAVLLHHTTVGYREGLEYTVGVRKLDRACRRRVQGPSRHTTPSSGFSTGVTRAAPSLRVQSDFCTRASITSRPLLNKPSPCPSCSPPLNKTCLSLSSLLLCCKR